MQAIEFSNPHKIFMWIVAVEAHHVHVKEYKNTQHLIEYQSMYI